jgi:hypothetical protein
MRRRGFLAAVAGLVTAAVVKVPEPKPVPKFMPGGWRNYSFQYTPAARAAAERRLRALVAKMEADFWHPPLEPFTPWGIDAWLTA